MSQHRQWDYVPVEGVLFVYLDGRYVGEIGKSRFARKGRRWWACSGWEGRRMRYASREDAIDSFQGMLGPGGTRSA